jgi:hypothetical protein
MALDSADVIVVGGGSVYLAPVGTAMPAGLVAPATPWENIGYIEEAGPAPTGFQRDKTSLFAWNTNTPLRTSYAPAEPAINFTLLQFTEDTLALYFGGGTTATASGTSTYTGPVTSTPQPWAMIIDWFDGTNAYRWEIPNTTVAAAGDITLTREQFMQLPVSASILAPAAGAAPFTLVWGTAPAGFGATMATPAQTEAQAPASQAA